MSEAPTLLEPISKSLEEDYQASELDKAQEVLWVILPSNEDATLPLNPCEEALDQIQIFYCAPCGHVETQAEELLDSYSAQLQEAIA